jgi:hypothetical protein
MLRSGPTSMRKRQPGARCICMTERDVFLVWVKTALYEAELALHNGDAGPRRALWSRNEPVSIFGAWRNAHGQRGLDELFMALGRSFSDCTSYAFELQAYDVVGDMAYTAGLEHTSASVDGRPRTYTLRWPIATGHRDRVRVLVGEHLCRYPSA